MRGYGTLKHNSRAVYQRYMGWYDANPSSLDNLPPEPAAKKYVEYMGGEAAVLTKAKADFDKGEYRWVAEALKHVVFANPDNADAKGLLADAFEQLGYQAESGPWRSVYLQGAFELRNGVPKAGGFNPASPERSRRCRPRCVRLSRSASQRSECGWQENRSERELHRPQQTVRPYGRERGTQLWQATGPA
jgi:alkyl sulfatase BDS1-like metallo-beta-lactamase superfamily hydrolase